ncbi:MAG: DNA mismatch repair protein [Bacteroidetes bacterium 46-16]|nr:MAG: DNA mismatch repair protein [Bacteroidetes bacterium 46-16]
MANFTFNISLSVLNHLGRNLYRNFITVLGEAISNSWDADAKNVWIYIDRDRDTLIVKDDGDGMTSEDFQKKFLKIGYSKRKDGKDKTDNNRPFIGRKGIGKLALLSCAKRIHVISKTSSTSFVGGVIDNGGLDKAIDDDLTPQEYPLENLDLTVFNQYQTNLEHGTIIFFEQINDGIRNRVEYLRKLIALFFRFSLIDNSFKIYLNNDPITLNELNDLSQSTQFVWQINSIDDPYLKDKISATSKHIMQYKKVTSSFQISGFIASVERPSQLKIRQTTETVTVDLYVNGRLREKDLLKHIPSTRVVESYLYGQIHFNALDGEKDRFTSSREGVISDDLLFTSFLEELNSIVRSIMTDWDTWRTALNQDGDPDNTRMTRKERKSKELFNTVVDEFIPPTTSQNRHIVDEWVNSLSEDAQFNVSSYAECFVCENLLRKFIKERNVTISNEAKGEFNTRKDNEEMNKNKANISFEIRNNANDLHYLSMDYLANLADMHKEHKMTALSRDAIMYKPIRDAMAHTAILTPIAKQSLSLTFENIKARVKKLLE